MVIFGGADGIDRLVQIDWLRDRDIAYWGDIDTHGFAWSKSELLMDGLPLQFNMDNMIALQAGPAFVIVSLPRRRRIQMDAAEREEKKKLTNIAKHRILFLLCC